MTPFRASSERCAGIWIWLINLIHKGIGVRVRWCGLLREAYILKDCLLPAVLCDMLRIILSSWSMVPPKQQNRTPLCGLKTQKVIMWAVFFSSSSSAHSWQFYHHVQCLPVDRCLLLIFFSDSVLFGVQEGHAHVKMPCFHPSLLHREYWSVSAPVF